MLQFPNINLVLHLNTIKDVEIFYSLILFVLNIQLKKWKSSKIKLVSGKFYYFRPSFLPLPFFLWNYTANAGIYDFSITTHILQGHKSFLCDQLIIKIIKQMHLPLSF